MQQHWDWFDGCSNQGGEDRDGDMDTEGAEVGHMLRETARSVVLAFQGVWNAIRSNHP